MKRETFYTSLNRCQIYFISSLPKIIFFFSFQRIYFWFFIKFSSQFFFLFFCYSLVIDWLIEQLVSFIRNVFRFRFENLGFWRNSESLKKCCHISHVGLDFCYSFPVVNWKRIIFSFSSPQFCFLYMDWDKIGLD